MEPEKGTGAPAVAPPASIKPGVKTTEFWLTTFAAIVSALLASGIFPAGGQVMQILGACGMVLSILGYGKFRSGVKKASILLFALALPFGAVGCSQGMIRADGISGLVEKVTERHDKLLRGELKPDQISEEDKATFLRSSEILRRTVKEARAP